MCVNKRIFKICASSIKDASDRVYALCDKTFGVYDCEIRYFHDRDEVVFAQTSSDLVFFAWLISRGKNAADFCYRCTVVFVVHKHARQHIVHAVLKRVFDIKEKVAVLDLFPSDHYSAFAVNRSLFYERVTGRPPPPLLTSDETFSLSSNLPYETTPDKFNCVFATHVFRVFLAVCGCRDDTVYKKAVLINFFHKCN